MKLKRFLPDKIKNKIPFTLRNKIKIWKCFETGENVKMVKPLCKSSLENTEVKIGDNTLICLNTEFEGKVKIGKHCMISRETAFIQRDHDMKRPSTGGPQLGEIEVGHDVWTGARTIILRNTKIGNGAVVGAGSVVTKDVEPYEIVGGNPVEHIRYRFKEEIRDKLQEIEWWNWSEQKKERNKDFFNTDLTKLSSGEELEELIKD